MPATQKPYRNPYTDIDSSLIVHLEFSAKIAVSIGVMFWSPSVMLNLAAFLVAFNLHANPKAEKITGSVN